MNANSVTTIKESQLQNTKRKRKETPQEFEEWESTVLAARKSQKIQRATNTRRGENTGESPEILPQAEVKATGKEENMEAIVQKLEEIKKELKDEFNKNHADLKADITKINEEFQKAKREWDKKAEVWQKEKIDMGNRIKNLEERLERQDREKRRNNLVIKGVKRDENQIEEQVEQLIKDKLKLSTKVKKGYTVKAKDDKQIIIVEMNSWEHKKDIMIRKGLLQSTNIWIENDLTFEESKIQAQLRKVMQEEKDKGNRVKMGYQKIIINGEKYEWNPSAQGIIK